MSAFDRAARTFAIVVVAGALATACASSGQAPGPKASTSPESGPFALVGKPAPGFRLLDQFHRPQRLSDYRGKLVLLTFVSSRCTAICPLTAELLTRTKELLGSDAHDTELIAVNANYFFNSVKDVLRWSKRQSMTHRWLFLTGGASTLLSVYNEYGVTPGSAHSTLIFVIDSKGMVRSVAPIASAKSLDAEARALARYLGGLDPP
jgi:cytochrome oxidase Cu insertion factor (SCO1/SenC/PrrC family)